MSATPQTTCPAPHLTRSPLVWLIIAVSAMLMVVDLFLKMPQLIGGWHMVLYGLLLTPLLYLLSKGAIRNRYTLWFLPFLLVMIADMFYYNNEMVQYLLPLIFYLLTTLLYLTAMQQLQAPYQTLLPKWAVRFQPLVCLRAFVGSLVAFTPERSLYRRIGLGLLIALPFVGIFGLLLFDADRVYAHTLRQLFNFSWVLSDRLVLVPLYLVGYLLFFLYSLSNITTQELATDTKPLDVVVVGIVLGMINLLFLSFVVFQLSFLLSMDGRYEVDIATFARRGFFHLMVVMGLVSLILLFIHRRFKGEKSITILLVLLLLQSMAMGAISLKKIYLYQSMMGATVLRYYVEWFDYFLMVVLLLGILFLVRRYAFATLMNSITFLGLIAFTLIVSLNIDAMVAKHNIEKFQNNPKKLDKQALRMLSIDALPVIKDYHITLEPKQDYHYPSTFPWYVEPQRHHCERFALYHYGYCSKLKRYGVHIPAKITGSTQKTDHPLNTPSPISEK